MASCHIKTLIQSAGATRESDRGCSEQDAWYIRAGWQVEIDFRGIFCWLVCRGTAIPNKDPEGQQYMRGE